MNAQQQRVLESFRRIQGWFQGNEQYVTSDGTATPNPVANQVRALNEVVDGVMDYVARQQTELAQSTLVSKDERELRREVLTYHMAPIARIAKALRGQVPGIGVLTMPKGNVQTAALITAAMVMARKAEVYAPVLVEQGLPTDFVLALTTVAGKLKESLDARGLARGSRASASRGLEAELALGRRLVTVLDVTMSRVLRHEPAKLAEWRHVKRVMVRGSAPRVPRAGEEDLPIGSELSPTGIVASPTRPDASLTRVAASPIRSEVSPTVLETSRIRREVPLNASQLSPTVVQGSPTVTELSPAVGEVPPIVGEKAA
ncbi:MAG TPA: hypothetical protein VEB21_01780 [Terriglobales bacterium]|nr:hypothetical protein [Terriglobales bacterium]